MLVDGWIKLKPIKNVYDDIVIVGDNKFEYRRYIEEEKAIRYVINKGYPLLNMKYPCKYWYDNDNLIERNTADDYMIWSLENVYDTTKNKDVRNYLIDKVIEYSL